MTETDTQGWFSEETATFGDRVTGAREGAGMTQDELAKRLGVKLKTVQAWENDMLEPRANRLQMMAGMLNVSLVWLLTGEGEGPDGPAPERSAATETRRALAELARIRAQALALARDLGQMERRMKALMEVSA
ncbi:MULTISPECIES: helix-turn-helix transcriptional regulator [Gemmobacter]|jgi:transcriptional regulator with XRE-family HTH domain|uniref:Xre family transcriptional regulator n=2 Tax=Gemmobacter TaxID=204456 RepID=A0A2T6AQ93_9RHOB|nr:MULTISPECIES: helix-turn-helix transcriptional regulator [Gemmobacter]OJY32689.1 MAG: transcriptional regulator [Rhodobacterales bacterium 65-51]PTX45998.1 Xre family transcriptional regulator [Gemmobacter caeni]TWI94300.1 helix-turn-helix protein [Gemmobacter caeni]GHC09585.1 transcriptional regulator [Gemmobacter nanjingensis]